MEAQIGDAWSTPNAHGIDLRRSLVSPRQITVIERTVGDGQHLVLVWLVLVEQPDTDSGYRIVLKEDDGIFGLAAEGFASDAHLVLSGWYGDFLTTFRGM